MAMTVCRECKGEVSTDAKACPHCGIKYPVKRGFFATLAAIAVLLGLGYLIVTVLGINDESAALDTCDELAPHVILVSEQGEGAIHLLKLFDVTDRKALAPSIRPDTGRLQNVLFCHAVGLTSRNTEQAIYFWLEEDADGEQFYGFEPATK